MRPTRRYALLSLLAGAAVAGCAYADTPPEALAGTFIGILKAGAARLRLKLVIAADGKATLFSLDQGNVAIPADATSYTITSMMLSFDSLKARYEGSLVDHDHIHGTFIQGGQALPLDLTRGETFSADPTAGPLTKESLHALRLDLGTPGMAAGWNRLNQSSVIMADGVRSAGSDTSVTTSDLWHLGSMSKSFTASLAGRCVEAGKLTWNTTVEDILGEKVPGMLAAYRTVSLLHLLSHRAGLQPNLPQAELLQFSAGTLTTARDDRLKYANIALRQTPAAALGEKMIYSNSGFVIAGAMLETVMGDAWENLITEQVFKPLGLGSGGFGPPETSGKFDQPSGHTISATGDRTPTHNDNPVVIGPAGRIHMAAGDLLSYLIAHRDQPRTFLTTQTWQTLHTPPFGGDYALGWIVASDGRLWHNGSNTYWYAEGVVDPKNGIVAATLANDAAGFAGIPGRVLIAARQAALERK